MNLRTCELDEEVEAGSFRHREVGVRPRLGGELIGCSLYEVPPGARLWPYHWHLNNEEWAIVVSGAPTVRTPEGERELREGDVLAFPEGEAGAHTFTNRTDEPVRVAIFSTLRPGNSFYPDSDKVAAGPPGDRRCYRRSDAVDYWTSEASDETAAR